MPRKITRSLWKMQRPGARRKSFENFSCYCSHADEILGVENKIPKLESAIKEDLVLKKQLESDLKQQSGGQKSGSCPLCVLASSHVCGVFVQSCVASHVSFLQFTVSELFLMPLRNSHFLFAKRFVM